MDRRSFVIGSTAAAATLATGAPAMAQDYPTRPVTFVNPFPPGGATDVVGRPFAAAIEPLLKQPALVETKPGAAGAVGAQFAASAKPDGYTLLLHIVSISGFAEVDKLFGREPKFTRDSFIPIARFTEGPMVLVVNDRAAVQDAEGAGRRRQEAAERADLQLVRPLRRAASADRAVHAGGRHPDAAPADRRRRAGAECDPRQQCAGAGVVDRGGQCAGQGRQGERARLLLGEARRLDARRADAEGTRLRRRVLALGRTVRAEGHAGRHRHRSCARTPSKAVAAPAFGKAIDNLGDVVAYLDQPDFAKFWDEDAKRVEAAVKSIGKVAG